MDDALLVRRFECVRNLPRDRQRVRRRDRSLRDPVGEGRPVDQLHDQCVPGPRILESVEVRDVRMIERREDLGFTPEPRQPVGIRRERLR